MNQNLCIGIDLGTTYSAIAWLNQHGEPEVLENEEGERTTPSVVLFDGDEIVVGSYAKDNLVAYPGQTVEFVKRFMGDGAWFSSTGAGSTRQRRFLRLILRKLKQDAWRQGWTGRSPRR